MVGLSGPAAIESDSRLALGETEISFALIFSPIIGATLIGNSSMVGLTSTTISQVPTSNLASTVAALSVTTPETHPRLIYAITIATKSSRKTASIRGLNKDLMANSFRLSSMAIIVCR